MSSHSKYKREEYNSCS